MIGKRRKLRVVMLADEKLLPTGRLDDFSEKERELRKTEYHVRDAIEALGHDLVAVGVLDDLSSIRGAIDAHKPHVVFNLVEEFNGIGFFDQHVVSYLELRGQAYTGCNPRGLTLARDKAVTKKILAYHGLPVPRFEVFPRRRKVRRPDWLQFPLFVKSLTEEGSAGISSASIVHTDAKLLERIAFIHSATKSAAIAEEFIDGREMYVGVMGNDSTRAFPAWEFSMTKKDPDRPLIASDRAKWDPAFQRAVGLRTGPANLPKSWATKLAAQSRDIYRLLGLSGYARLDYRVTESGRAYLLEANPNPQIAEDEDFAASARHAGVSYPELIGMLLRYGTSYKPTRMVL
jgi:D-alanine-D-alanine ligase